MNKIDINNLTKNYGNNKGVFNVSLTIKKGEVFGFLGPNGAGKTTTIRNLLGFIKPDSGNCRIDNLDFFLDSYLINSNVGYLPGEIFFIDNLNGDDFIKFIAEYRHQENLDRADELIKRFELDPKGKIKKMSKGMKQKLAIVVAFMHDPDLLILDEPTSGLDPLMQKKFIDLLLEEKGRGKTIFISSHIFEEIEKTCDRVAIIKSGRIVATDTINNLRKKKSKKYTITFNSKQDLDNFKNKDFAIVDEHDNTATVLIKNNINELIKYLSNYQIIDFDEEYQNLEDIFMSYYGGVDND